MMRRLTLMAILFSGLVVSALCVVGRWQTVGWNFQTADAGYGLFFHRPGMQFHQFSVSDGPIAREGSVNVWRMGVGYAAYAVHDFGKFTLIGPSFEMGGYRVIGDEEGNARKCLRYRMLVLPPWLLFALLVVSPAALLARGPLRRYRRRKRGLCLRCGYNLTGLPEPRCPECGAST